MARPSKRRLAGRSNQIKSMLELEAQALLQSEEVTGPPSKSNEESDLEIPGIGRESDMEFNLVLYSIQGMTLLTCLENYV